MNLKEIRQIINLMNENDITEIELEREGSKIKLKKGSYEVYEPVTKPKMDYRVEQPSSQQPETSVESGGSSGKEICSPMVGTFYSSPSPEAPPFVEVGQTIEVGQVVCIVEAMKLMNEIKSEVRGKVTNIPVSNAQPVEFGQALFIVEPI